MRSLPFVRYLIIVTYFLLLSLAACAPESETMVTPTVAISAAPATTAVATTTPTGQPTSIPTSLPPSPTTTITATVTFSPATAETLPLPATPTVTIFEPSSTATECPTATEETWLLRNPEYGYCLLYPIAYQVVKSGASTSISSYGLTLDVKPFVTIFVEPAGGRTAEAVANQLAADYKDFSDWIERSTISVGGEAAFSLGKLPGQDFSQAVFFVHDDLLYSLTLFPDVDEPGPKMFHDMVLSSFTFIPRSNEATTEECFEPKANMQLLRDEEQGYCLLYFSEYQVERPDESETVLAIGSPHNFAEPRITIEVQDAAGRTAEEVADEIIAEFENYAVERTLGLMDYVAVDYLEPVPGQTPGRQVLTVYDGRLYKLTFTPADVNQSEELFWLILTSFRFLPPSSGSCVNNSEFVRDVNVPDGTHVASGASFSKTWRLRNSGACTWDASFTLDFVDGEQMAGPQSLAIAENVPPGGEIDLSINLTAPLAAGTYRGRWQLAVPDGTLFGIKPYVDIVVP